MRITDASFARSVVDQLEPQEAAIAELDNELASGQAFTKPSDDPTGVSEALALQAQVAQTSTWRTNVSTAQSWLGLANSTANSVMDALQQARTVLLEAMNQGTESASTYRALAEQVAGISDNLLSLANTSYGGRPLFAGTAAASAAYSPTGSYQGNASPPALVVGPGAPPGQLLAMSVTGPELFGSGSASIFSVLSQAESDLASGSPTTSALQSDLSALDGAIATATAGAAALGNLSSQASSLSSALAGQATQLKNQLGSLASANVPELETELQSELTNYQSALWVAAHAVPPSLVEYL